MGIDKVGIICMSVQCVHGTQGEPANEAMSMAYLNSFLTSLYFYVLFMNVTNEQK